MTGFRTGENVSGIRLRNDTCSSEVRNERPQKYIIFLNKDNSGEKDERKDDDDADNDEAISPWDTMWPAVILNPANEDDYLRSCTGISRANEAIIEPLTLLARATRNVENLLRPVCSQSRHCRL